ncbi:MAG: hypothetical protein ABL957_12820 [Parvularculaceae bacterium]
MRPTTIAEVASRAAAGGGVFDRAVREFVDFWQSASTDERRKALAREPAKLDGVKDAYLAALTEHLALSARIDVPEWSEKDARFLKEPFFAGGIESLKAILLVESPLAFRRRLIFISADALSRPRRDFARDPA